MQSCWLSVCGTSLLFSAVMTTFLSVELRHTPSQAPPRHQILLVGRHIDARHPPRVVAVRSDRGAVVRLAVVAGDRRVVAARVEQLRGGEAETADGHGVIYARPDSPHKPWIERTTLLFFTLTRLIVPSLWPDASNSPSADYVEGTNKKYHRQTHDEATVGVDLTAALERLES